MKKYICSIPVLVLLIFSACPPVAAQPTVPQFAAAIGRDLDRQMGGGVSLMMTTPVHVDNFRESNTLARQMQEEVMGWLVRSGYNVLEIRKACSLLVDEHSGEFALTRRPGLMAAAEPSAGGVVAATYVVTPFSVRFNFKVIAAGSQETLAMSSITIPMTKELATLLGGTGGGGGGGGSGVVLASSGIPMEPTVVTRLP